MGVSDIISIWSPHESFLAMLPHLQITVPCGTYTVILNDKLLGLSLMYHYKTGYVYINCWAESQVFDLFSRFCVSLLIVSLSTIHSAEASLVLLFRPKRNDPFKLDLVKHVISAARQQ